MAVARRGVRSRIATSSVAEFSFLLLEVAVGLRRQGVRTIYARCAVGRRWPCQVASVLSRRTGALRLPAPNQSLSVQPPLPRRFAAVTFTLVLRQGPVSRCRLDLPMRRKVGPFFRKAV